MLIFTNILFIISNNVDTANQIHNIVEIKDTLLKIKYLKPGKIDININVNSNSNDYNFMYWTPLTKFGIGFIDLPNNSYAQYGGIYINPLLLIKNTARKNSGDLILGYNYTYYKDAISNLNLDGLYWDLQGEYNSKIGLGVGAGCIKEKFFESPSGYSRNYDYFTKVSYKGKIHNEWKYKVYAMLQTFNHNIKGGAFIAFYGPHGSISGGYDYESFRVSLGLISKKDKKYFKPAAEIIYIDKKIGINTIAPQIFFISGSLKYKQGGFLSNESRLGRTMGSAGMEYYNPLSVLTPINDGNPLFNIYKNPGVAIWNRQLNTWELGDLINFRLLHFILPNKSHWGNANVVFFPFQYMKNRKYFLENIFLGSTYYYYKKVPMGQNEINNFSIACGFAHKVKTFSVNLQLEYNINIKNVSFNTGFIHYF